MNRCHFHSCFSRKKKKCMPHITVSSKHVTRQMKKCISENSLHTKVPMSVQRILLPSLSYFIMGQERSVQQSVSTTNEKSCKAPHLNLLPALPAISPRHSPPNSCLAQTQNLLSSLWVTAIWSGLLFLTSCHCSERELPSHLVEHLQRHELPPETPPVRAACPVPLQVTAAGNQERPVCTTDGSRVQPIHTNHEMVLMLEH